MDAGESSAHGHAVKARVGHAARKRLKQGRLLCAYLVKRRGQKRGIGRTYLRKLRRTRDPGVRVLKAVQEVDCSCRAGGVAKGCGGRADQPETQDLSGPSVAGDIDVAGAVEIDEGSRTLEIVERDGERVAWK